MKILKIGIKQSKKINKRYIIYSSKNLSTFDDAKGSPVKKVDVLVQYCLYNAKTSPT